VKWDRGLNLSLCCSTGAEEHGLEESGGTNFLVLELVEGQTLADRIKIKLDSNV